MESLTETFQKMPSSVKGDQPSPSNSGNEDKTEAQRMILDINKCDTDGDTVLHKEATAGDSHQLAAVIKAGADVNITNKNRQTALFRAAKKGHDDCVEILIKSGANVNLIDRDGNTALVKSAEKGHGKCVKFLVDAGTDVNRKNKFGHTALFRAIKHRKRECFNCVEILLKSGADVNIVTKHGTCITQSIMSGGVLETKALLRAGADVNLPNADGLTGIYEAAKMGKIDKVKIFVDAGADVNRAIPPQNFTPLMEAVRAGNIDLVRLLINAGADVNKYTKYQVETALIIAAAKNHIECINLLTQAGAHVNSIDNDGNTALISLAYDLNHTGIIGTAKTLLRLGAHVNKNSDVARKAIQFNLQYSNEHQLLPLLIAAGETVTEEEIQQIISEQWLGDNSDVRYHFFPSDPVLILSHLCRGAIRERLLDVDPHVNLFIRVPKIGLPSRLTKYLLFDVSLD